MDLSWVFSGTHGQEWSRCQTLHAGPPPWDRPWKYVLISQDGRPWLRLCLERREDEACAFEECLYWGQAIWIGFGSRVIRLGLPDLAEREISVDCYFGSFFPVENGLLVCSASRLLKLDRLGNEVWISPELGVDGVLVYQVSDGVIEGQGEWDPPGGWRDFRVDLARGDLLA